MFFCLDGVSFSAQSQNEAVGRLKDTQTIFHRRRAEERPVKAGRKLETNPIEEAQTFAVPF